MEKSACRLSTRWLLVHQQPSQPAQKGNQDPQALGTFRGRCHRIQSVKFSPTHTTLAQPCHFIGRQHRAYGGTQAKTTQSVEVSKHRQRNSIYNSKTVCLIKMARVVDGGFAYRASEMITRAALLSTSQMLENSVPNSSVLVISLQQSEKSRECICIHVDA